MLGVAGWTTTRTRFSGHGPHSSADGDLFLDRLAAEAEARLAWAPAGPRGVLLQPTARFRFDRLRGFEEATAGGLISAALLWVAGASKYYAGGGVVYTLASRTALVRSIPIFM